MTEENNYQPISSMAFHHMKQYLRQQADTWAMWEKLVNNYGDAQNEIERLRQVVLDQQKVIDQYRDIEAERFKNHMQNDTLPTLEKKNKPDEKFGRFVYIDGVLTAIDAAGKPIS